jgi:hypothetical protein
VIVLSQARCTSGCGLIGSLAFTAGSGGDDSVTPAGIAPLVSSLTRSPRLMLHHDMHICTTTNEELLPLMQRPLTDRS